MNEKGNPMGKEQIIVQLNPDVPPTGVFYEV